MRLTFIKYLALPATLALSLGVASAQSDTANKTAASTNSAVDPGNTATKDRMVASSALQKGANSFTEGEARSRLESAGLSNVTDLKKDDAGIWRGKANHDGKSVSVGLDYKGSMSAE